MSLSVNFLIKSFIVGLFFLIFLPFANAASTINSNSVVGNWQTFDEKTKLVSSIIKICQQGQYYVGTIVKTFPSPGEKPKKLCTACPGNLNDKPFIGMQIIQNMICAHGACTGGTILDPRSGQIYHAKMHLVNGGNQLKVRGYVGAPLFGKTVIWQRLVKNAGNTAQ